MLSDSLNTLICTPNASYSHRFQWILYPPLDHYPHFHNSTHRNSYVSQIRQILHYCQRTTVYLLETDKELHRLVHTIELINQSNHCLEEIQIWQEQFAHSQFQLALQNSNITLGVSHKKYAYKNFHRNGLTPPQPLHGDPQDPLYPVDEILHLYSDM